MIVGPPSDKQISTGSPRHQYTQLSNAPLLHETHGARNFAEHLASFTEDDGVEGMGVLNGIHILSHCAELSVSNRDQGGAVEGGGAALAECA